MDVNDARIMLEKALQEYNNGVPDENSSCSGHNLDMEDYRRRRAKLDRVVFALSAHPHVFRHLRIWMVDVHGKSESDDPVGEAMSVESDAVAMIERACATAGGGLREQVMRALSEFNLTDRGAGMGSWDLGYHCTDAEATAACHVLCSRFARAIRRGYLRVERKPWSARWA